MSNISADPPPMQGLTTPINDTLVKAMERHAVC